MTPELTCLALALVLALVQLLVASMARVIQFGGEWGAGPRDADPAPLRPLPARLLRAQANLMETLPIFAAAVLIATAAGRTGPLTEWGGWVYLAARIVYVPLYAFGVRGVRSVVWVIATLGLAAVLLGLALPG